MLNELEIAVLKLMLKEHSSNLIAQELGLSIMQVSEIRKDIYQKLEVKNQIGLIKKCIQESIIDIKELLDIH